MTIGVGIIGAGNISTQYLTNLTSYPDVEVVAIDDLIVERAQAQAEKFGVPTWGGENTVLNTPGVDIVVNITPPEVHIDAGETDAETAARMVVEKLREMGFIGN